jgi:Flp pilus assembly secretin CpaC
MSMGKNCHKISRREGILVAFAILASAGLTGCKDWPDERATTIEAQNILRDLGRIETIPDPNIKGPSIYQSPPKKIKQTVGGGEEWKLIYFCRCHTAEEMKQIINEQFATKLFDEKGKSANINDYTVTANTATNQLIVRCPLELDIDAVLEIIKEIDIPPIQVRIDCMVSELYADLTVDRETSMAIKNLFGEGVTLGGQENNGDLAFPGAELRDPARAKFGLKVGVNQDHFKALVDVLVSRGYMKILMNPSLEIVNGETAKIQSKQHQPLQQITVQSGGYGGVPVLSTQTEYYEVIDSLQITPHVYAEGYIGLETTAQIAAYLTPEGIKQTPIVTERTITNKDNRIRLGESLVIGGIRKSEKRDVIRGVPILKDIPLLGWLFSGRDFEERATEVIFILTPSISTKGKPNKDMMEMLKNRHASPESRGLSETVMDPLGTKARREEEERRFEKARLAQQESEAEMTAARQQAIQTGQQVEDLEAELEKNRARTAQLSVEAQQAAVENQQIKAELQKTQQKAEKPPEAKPNQNKSDKPKEEPKPAGPTPPPQGGAPSAQPPQQK